MAGRLQASSDTLYLPGTSAPDRGSFTLTALVYLSGSPNSGNYEAINAWSNRYTGGHYFFSGKRSGDSVGYIDTSGSNARFAPDNGVLPQDEWFQWALVGDRTAGVGGEHRAYWKRIADVTWNAATAIWTGIQDFGPDFWMLGNSEFNDSVGRFRFSNVRVWSVPLTVPQITADANSASVVHAANLRNWWKMLPAALLHDSGPAAIDLLTCKASPSGLDTGTAGVFVTFTDSPLEAPPDTIDVGFNFRSTLGYVTDGANENFINNAGPSFYPHTVGGVTFGWTNGVNGAGVQVGDQDAGVDRRLAGDAFTNNAVGTVDFQVDLPSVEPVDVHLAIGFPTADLVGLGIEVLDGNGLLFALGPTDMTAGQVMDATGALRTMSTWPATELPHTVTPTTAFLLFRMRGQYPVDRYTVLRHVRVVTSSGEAPPDDVTGAVSGALPLLTGAGSGQYVESGVGAGQLPLLVGAGSGQYVESGGVTGQLPVLVGAGSGQYTEFVAVVGLLPLLVGAGEGTLTALVSGAITAFLPLLVGSAFGQITTTRKEAAAPDIVGDDPNEFGRPLNFSGKIGGARGFAQQTFGSKMQGGKSQVRKPGHPKWQ